MNLIQRNLVSRKYLTGVVTHIEVKKCCLGLLTLILLGIVIGETYLYVLVQKSDGRLPVTMKVNGSFHVPCHPQPYCYIDMKTLFLDLPEFYIFAPMAAFMCDLESCGSPTSFLSANAITICHGILALILAIFVSSDSLRTRRFGLLLFLVRNILDALDGAVARARWHEPQHSGDPDLRGSVGYYLDGLSDGFGTTLLVFACFLYTSRRRPRGKTRWSFLTSAFVFGMQILLSSVCWNRYITAYMNLLETNPATRIAGDSKMMWLVIVLWRLMNPHSLIHVLLLTVYLDKALEFMVWMQYIGFLPLVVSALLSEVHVNDVQLYLLDATNI